MPHFTETTYDLMKLDDYEQMTNITAKYPEMGKIGGLVYCVLGLTGESGEVAEKVKKILRDQDGMISDEQRDLLALELGDVLWYLTRLCIELNVPLSEVAWRNLEKLQSRKERGVIGGSGDKR